MAERKPVLPEDIDLTGGVTDPLQEVLCHDLAREVLERLSEHCPSDASLHAEILAEIHGGLLAFYGLLAERGLVDPDDFADLRTTHCTLSGTFGPASNTIWCIMAA